ncbi:DEAD/DEAH box helicase [Flavobacterium urocaniciphilum]|uniref:DEAD/DEAH box helicase n=1 Tax=Flavobacterium urocaniciphilum TaxID=1299341 RepID=A0A1H8YWZ5_9FLAO|nr:DEAD/DEAH box helicase [Flavobacterium urocaniciphilum]SEP56603.1 DEAD/DEAH box helicase [Flavobacterium urocaniciphilum]
MQLKKINPHLQEALIENGLTEANEMQQETFSTIKSGADAVIQSDRKSGKSTTIALNVIQRLDKPFMESPRALIIVETKEKVLQMVDIFKDLNRYNKLRVYGVHDRGDLDWDKNQISLGIDVLIGTATRLDEMFSTAGFDVNQLKMVVVDDADILFKLRMDAKVNRLSDSIGKTQRLIFCNKITERVEAVADRIMIEPLFFEMEE